MEKTKSKAAVQKLAVSAVMLALAFILSYITVWKMPFGGTVTAFSMLPICFVSIKYGLKWGLGTAFCYSSLQLFQAIGEIVGWGLTPVMLAATIVLDYLLAFTVIGLAGLFRKKGPAGMIAGAAAACVLRFLVHFVSGVVLWANFDKFVAFGVEWVDKPVLYSLCYNGAFMLPETALTVFGVVILSVIPQVKKLIRPV